MKNLKKLLAVSLAGSLLVGGHLVQAQESTTSEAESTEEATSQAESTDKSEVFQAYEDAIAAFQEAYPEAQIEEIDVELLNDDTFEVEIEGFQGNEEVDATYMSRDGQLTERSAEVDDDGDKQALDLDAVISIDEATEIANGETGLTNPTNWKLDANASRTVWEVNYDDQAQEAEVDIDALTGEVLGVELDD